MTYKEPDMAFDLALSRGRLSTNEDAPNYAGNYMYMGTEEDGWDLFKNINSRAYDV